MVLIHCQHTDMFLLYLGSRLYNNVHIHLLSSNLYPTIIKSLISLHQYFYTYSWLLNQLACVPNHSCGEFRGISVSNLHNDKESCHLRLVNLRYLTCVLMEKLTSLISRHIKKINTYSRISLS